MDVGEKQNKSLFKTENYFNRFYEIKGVELTDKVAWEKLEEEFHQLHDAYKYASFGSFKVSKWRYLRKLRQKVNIVNPKG